MQLMQQAKVSKEYPSHHSATALMALMGAIQATAFALCVEKDWSQWNLGSSIRLLTALFSVYIYIYRYMLVSYNYMWDLQSYKSFFLT